MLSDYRQRFGEYHSEFHREDFLFRSGRQTSRDLAHIHSEFSDLSRLSVVEELRAQLSEVSEYRKTERTAIQRLIAFALKGNLFARARELSSEIENYEAAAKIDWNGERIALTSLKNCWQANLTASAAANFIAAEPISSKPFRIYWPNASTNCTPEPLSWALKTFRRCANWILAS